MTWALRCATGAEHARDGFFILGSSAGVPSFAPSTYDLTIVPRFVLVPSFELSMASMHACMRGGSKFSLLTH